MAEGTVKVDIDLNIIDNNSQYSKARRRFYNIYHRDISDKEIIQELCREIDYYRDKIELLTKVHRENVDCINKQDKMIEEYQEVLKKVEEGNDNTDDIKEIETISMYADGKVIETITRYKYKQEAE